MKHTTLLFLIKDDTKEICLAMKKRGFGKSKFNGVGGKVEEGETISQAAVREAKEEIGVDVIENDLEKVAELHFISTKPYWDIFCTTFVARRWIGEPAETEEMAPQWFSLSDIPYQKMWIDDIYWLPKVLRGERIKGSFTFNADGSEVVEQHIESWT